MVKSPNKVKNPFKTGLTSQSHTRINKILQYVPLVITLLKWGIVCYDGSIENQRIILQGG